MKLSLPALLVTIVGTSLHEEGCSQQDQTTRNRIRYVRPLTKARKQYSDESRDAGIGLESLLAEDKRHLERLLDMTSMEGSEETTSTSSLTPSRTPPITDPTISSPAFELLTSSTIPSSPPRNSKNSTDDSSKVTRSIWDILQSRNEEFSVLIQMAESIGFETVLQKSGEMTIFAPDNEAFNQLLPADLLEKYFDFEKWTEDYIKSFFDCLEIDGTALFVSQIRNRTQILSCMDLLDPTFLVVASPLRISKSTMPVDAKFIERDLQASNGILHIVDQVMTNSFLRVNLQEAAREFGSFDIFLELTVVAGLSDFLAGPGPFTLYAPRDIALEAYGQEFIDGLKADPNGTRELVLNHIVSDQIVSCCSTHSEQFQSAAGFPLMIEIMDANDPRNYTINGISTFPDLAELLFSNAKLTAINDVVFVP